MELREKFGFGCMRLPMNGDSVDYPEFTRMIDAFMEVGFNYFDTAHGYLDGKSELAIKDCLVARYPRDSYYLTDKLTTHYFNTEEEIVPLFEKQLKNTGVDYFDYYFFHSVTAKNYVKFTNTHAFEHVQKFKEEGRIKHIGMSFHDKAEVLDRVLSEHPEIEVVQIQFNYADYEDESIESKKVYDVCVKYNKPVLVMEPIKGGALVNLPDHAKVHLDALNGGSYASYAIRFAASFENVMMVLSGMSNFEQLQDNISYMKDFKPFTKEEYEAVFKVRDELKTLGDIKCTACRYCVDGCPKNISIPDLFSCYNAKKIFNDWNSAFYYETHTANKGKASDCIKCGKCEITCPQHLNIRDLLEEVANTFEKKA